MGLAVDPLPDMLWLPRPYSLDRFDILVGFGPPCIRRLLREAVRLYTSRLQKLQMYE